MEEEIFEATVDIRTKAKLLFLMTNSDPNHPLRKHTKNETTAIAALKSAVETKSGCHIDQLLRDNIKSLVALTYSKEAHGLNWYRKVNFMTAVESIRYLKIELKPKLTSDLEEKVNIVREKCCMENVDEISQVFLLNENLSIIKICDLLTDQQVKSLWDKCCTEFASKDNDGCEKFSQAEITDRDMEQPGMKEFVFLYLVRYMELQQKINMLFRDQLIEFLEESCQRDKDDVKFKKVLYILDSYDIGTRPPGYCLIFWMNENREGADTEKSNLEKIFKNLLGYKVKIVENPTIVDVEMEAENCYTDEQLKVYDSFVCWFLGHGSNQNLCLKDKEPLSREKFLTMFSKETCFAKKPKIFFMGTCLGTGYIHVPEKGKTGFSAEGDAERGSTQAPVISEANKEIMTVHAMSDRLVAYSTLPDKYSFRDNRYGSMFAAFICEQIEKYPGSNIVDILQRTTRKIQSILFSSEEFQGYGKQGCYYESTLQKNFYFPRPG